MNAKTYGIGAAGGILLWVLLTYSLTVYLPGRVVAEMPQGQAWLAWALTVAGVLLIPLTGAVAARFSGASDRKGAAIAGTIAGLTAALIAEIALGGAAAGVWGNREILAFGLNPTRDDTQLIELLSNAVVSSLLWTYISIWIALVGGAGLGALGAVLSGHGKTRAPENLLLQSNLIVSGALASTLALVVAFFVFPLLADSIQEGYDKAGIEAGFSPSIFNAIPIVTTYLTLIFWQIMGWRMARRWQADEAVRGAITPASTILLGAVPLLAAVMMLFAGFESFSFWIGICAIASLVFGALTIQQGIEMRRAAKTTALQMDNVTGALAGALTAGILIGTGYIGATAAALNITMLDVTMIAALSMRDPARAAEEAARVVGGVPGLVQANYDVHRSILYLGLAMSVFLVLFGIFFAWLTRVAAGRKSAQAN